MPYTVLHFTSCHASCAYSLDIDWLFAWQRNMEKSSYAFKTGILVMQREGSHQEELV